MTQSLVALSNGVSVDHIDSRVVLSDGGEPD